MKLALLAVLALAQEEKSDVLVLKAGKVYTVSKGVVDDGMVLIRAGKIEKVGRGIDVPAGATVIDLGKSASIAPGFIDLHSRLGSAFETDENVEAVTPHLRALDGFAADHPDVARALSSGVTTVVLAPGDGNLVGGRAAVLRLTGGPLHKLIYREAWGLKLSLTREATPRDREPTSRSGAMELLRRHLRDANGEVHRVIVKGGEPALIRAAAADEIQRAASLKQEFGLRAVVVGADEALRTLEELRKSGAAAALGPLTVSDSREKLETPGRLARAGVRFGFISDAPATDEACLRASAAFAVKYGLDRDDALRALTLWAAEILGLSDALGSIDEGKLADLVAYGGEPLSLASDVELVVVGGRIVYRKKK